MCLYNIFGILFFTEPKTINYKKSYVLCPLAKRSYIFNKGWN